MRALASTVFLAATLLGSARADTDSLNDLLGPREVAVGEAMRGGATGSSAIGLNPAGLPLNRELVFEGGYGYRASDSASLVGVSACDSTNALPGCFFYDYAASNPDLDGTSLHRTTHIAGFAMSRTLVPRVMVGAVIKYFHFDSDVMGETSTSGTTYDFGATIRVTDLINFGISTQNLLATTRSDQMPRALGGGVLARPIPTLALSFDMRWKLDGDDQAARYGGGLEYFAHTQDYGYPIRLGALHDNGLDATYISGGLGLAGLKWGLDISARREVQGGHETLVLASMRFYGPRMASPPLQ